MPAFLDPDSLAADTAGPLACTVYLATLRQAMDTEARKKVAAAERAAKWAMVEEEDRAAQREAERQAEIQRQQAQAIPRESLGRALTLVGTAGASCT